MRCIKRILTLHLIITCLTVLGIEPLYAQFYIGPKAGARLSWFEYEDFDTEAYKKEPSFGYNVGVSTAFKVRKRIFLECDVLYSNQKKIVKGVIDQRLKNKATYHYLNLPILYKVDFSQSLWDRNFKWYMGAGPNINLWLGGKGSLKAVELFEESIDKLNYEISFEEYPEDPVLGLLYVPEANRVQLGLIFSSGLKFEPAPGQTLNVELQFQWGHSVMANQEALFGGVFAYQDDFRTKAHSVQLSVSYMFDIITKGKKEKRLYYEKLD
ncbi:outer membrane beta-barrel protein [Marivirga atlantica]|uniref:PorT family protein n=1 Tax=Marivirga atlantica TaxID=1548457 RepID=A0A937A7X4_9BACT|nr:outer membrane beta-barrel protein [Marivirga atlantica]MBL0763830.1 PorT family protein [Marivirga atlantica]